MLCCSDLARKLALCVMSMLDWLAFLQFEEVLRAIAIRATLIHFCANVQVLISRGARIWRLPLRISKARANAVFAARLISSRSFPMLEASFCADVHRYQVHNQTWAFIYFHFLSLTICCRVWRLKTAQFSNFVFILHSFKCL